MQDLEAVGPQRPVPRLRPRPARVELAEVEQEIDLDVPLVAAELGEPAGEERGGERAGRAGEDGGVHRVTSSHHARIVSRGFERARMALAALPCADRGPDLRRRLELVERLMPVAYQRERALLLRTRGPERVSRSRASRTKWVQTGYMGNNMDRQHG
jgi:hypothetical protein